MTRDVRARGEALRTLVVFEAVIVGYLIVLLRDRIVPEHFKSDGYFIQRIALGTDAGDVKYTNTANVYAFLGLADQPMLAAILGYSLAAFTTIVVWAKLRRTHSSWAMIIITVAALLLSAVYLGWYSKDVLVLPVVLAVLLLPNRKLGWLACVAAMVGYAYLFREYWYLVAGLFVAFWIVAPRLRAVRSLVIGALATTAASAAIVVVQGLPANAYRAGANEYRLSMDIGTIITPFVSLPEPAGGIVNNVLTFFALVIPVPVALQGGLYYLAIAGIIGMLWVLLLRSVRFAHDYVSRRAVALTLAFVCVQAVFEPDYGSALRHLTPLLPLFLWVVWQGTAARVAAASGDTSLRTPEAIPAATVR